MPIAESPGPKRPDVETPRTFGILNIAYAVALMACGLCQNVTFAIPSLISQGGVKVTIGGRSANMPPAGKPAGPDLAARLEALEAATTDPAAKAAVASIRRREAADRAVPPVAVLADAGARDPRLVGHIVFDLASGLALNLMMLVAGVGLLFLKGWGRVLAIVVAWAKVLRLLALALMMTFVASPGVIQLLGSIEAVVAAPAGPAVAESIRGALVWFAWTMFVLGSIYPLATIYFLGRRNVRVAFSPRSTS